MFTYLKKPNSQGSIKLNAKEQALTMKLLEKRCSSREMKIIKDQIEAYGQAKSLNEALFVELRKAYEGAYDRAYKAFRKSDHRYPWEFWAIQYGLINTKQYTHQGEIAPR